MNLDPLIQKPTLLLDITRALRNIDQMVDKAQHSGVHFRPHFKTHQSAEIGHWFRARGVTAITVSSVDMARYFADHGWQDILIAFPINLRQLADINELAGRITLHLLVESAETVRQLSQGLRHDVQVWLKIDAGYGRTGLPWQDGAAITAVAEAITQAPHLRLAGLLTHSGHTYRATSAGEAAHIFQESVQRMRAAQTGLREQGVETAVSVGDTPGCSAVTRFDGIDEIRPGNFIFYDLTQLQIGICAEEQIAIAVACPVVAKHARQQRIILYGGAVHLSKEFLLEADGQMSFGRVAYLTDNGWSPIIANACVTSLSQEHGIVQADEAMFNSVQVGDLLAVLPVHSCLTANLLGRYLTLDGQWIEMAHW
jgi:D-serine deaminase-like pyridoxal phosphate-dependent protein